MRLAPHHRSPRPTLNSSAARLLGVAALALLFVSPARAQLGLDDPELPAEHPCRAEAWTSAESIAPGQPFTLAVRFRMDPHWHVYWHSPRDGGTRTVVEWKGPEGFRFGETQWPYPVRLVDDVGFVSHAYEPEVVLLTEVTPPKQYRGPRTIEFEASAYWLVCKEMCLEGSADLTVSTSWDIVARPSDRAKAIAEWRARVPAGAPGKLGMTFDSDWAPAAETGVWKTRFRLPEGESLAFDSVQILPWDPKQGRIAEPRLKPITVDGKTIGVEAEFDVRLGGQGFDPKWLGATCRYEPTPAGPTDHSEKPNSKNASESDSQSHSEKSASSGKRPTRAFDFRHVSDAGQNENK